VQARPNLPNIVPLKNRMHKRVFEVFPANVKSSKRHPLKLYLYLSVEKEIKNKMDDPVLFSDQIVKYLSNLIVPNVEVYQTDQVKAEFRQSFSALPRVLLSSAALAEASDPWEAIGDDNGDGEGDPLYIISSQSLQVIPWEFILSHKLSVVRAWTLGDITKKNQKSSSTRRFAEVSNPTKTRLPPVDKRADKQRLSSLWIGYYSQSRVLNEATVVNRQWWLKQHVFHLLNLGRKVPWDCNNLFMFPLVSPVVRHSSRISTYKRRFKTVQFYDYCEFHSVPDILRLLDENNENLMATGNNVILLFTYIDLLEMTDCLHVLRERLPTTIFVPSQKAKLFVSRLYKAQVSMLKKSSGKLTTYSLLMSAVKVVQKELQVPICIFNPPRDDE